MLHVYVLLVGKWTLTDRRGGGRNQQRWSRRSGRKGESQTILAGDAQGSKGMAEAIDYAQSILESVLRETRPPELRALLDWVFSAEGSTSRSTNNKLPISQVSYTLHADMLVLH